MLISRYHRMKHSGQPRCVKATDRHISLRAIGRKSRKKNRVRHRRRNVVACSHTRQNSMGRNYTDSGGEIYVCPVIILTVYVEIDDRVRVARRWISRPRKRKRHRRRDIYHRYETAFVPISVFHRNWLFLSTVLAQRLVSVSVLFRLCENCVICNVYANLRGFADLRKRVLVLYLSLSGAIRNVTYLGFVLLTILSKWVSSCLGVLFKFGTVIYWSNR